MLIGDKYKIESDDMQYIISIIRTAKSGKLEGVSSWRVEAYFKTLPEAIKWLVDREIRGTGLVDLLEVNKKIEELKRTLIREYSKAL